MPFTQPRQFLTTTEAAKYLGGRSTHRTVVALIQKGQLKGKKVSKGWRILPEWLDEYMSQPDNVNPHE
jgi:excisionase family DNA binding protein